MNLATDIARLLTMAQKLYQFLSKKFFVRKEFRDFFKNPPRDFKILKISKIDEKLKNG